ncbi:MAG: tetratricopeptide repeat protein [Deltaproteobacteria bacterium]|nr:tetratricopeptide repeat protein [Deltaproteobacteria bacterium]
MSEPLDPSRIPELLPQWASGRVTLKDIKGYTDDELYAIAHTGYFFLMQGKNDEAKTLFEGLVAIDPRSAYYRRALGVIFHKMGDAERAIQQFSSAIQVAPRGAASYINRAEVFITLSRRAEAQADLKTALDCVTKKENNLRKKAGALLHALTR